MTVCIAALCNVDEVPVIIAISDRMITIGNREFEPDQTKLVYFAERTVALLAGTMQFHADVTPRAYEHLRRTADTGNVTVRQVADSYAHEFAARRREKAALQFLAPLELDLETFITKQKDMLPTEVATLRTHLRDAEVDAPAIITGIDNLGGHIFLVTDPGEVHSFDMSSFCAIGLGDQVALSEFQTAGYEKRWPFAKALFLTYSAKKKAEAIVGVGKKTDVVLIRPGYQITRLSESQVATLDGIYREKVAADAEAEQKAIDRLVEEIKKVAAEEEAATGKPQEVLDEKAGEKAQRDIEDEKP